MAERIIRQREDRPYEWDVIEEGPDGRPRVSIIDTATAARLQREGKGRITDGAGWGEAAKALEERAGVLAKGGAGQPGMVHALDENDEPVVASLDTARQRGWEVVTPEMAARAGDAVMARQPPEVAVSTQKVAPEVVRSAPRAAPRPGVSVQRVGAGGAPRAFQSLAGEAPPIPEDAVGVATRSVQDGPPPPRGDAEFSAAQEEGRRRRIATGLGRAGAMANEALTGVGFDADIYSDAGADLPVKDLLARREADKSKALEDPDSEQSIRFRAAVQKAMPGVYAPEELAQMTAADEPHVMQYGAMRQRLDERAAERTRAEEQRQADMARQDALRTDERGYQEKQAVASRAFQAGEAAKQRAFQREMAGLNNAADLEQAQARGIGPTGTRIQERNVGGFTFDPANPPTAAAAKQMADAAVARDEILGSLERLEALFEQHGTEAGGGAAQSEMESEQMNITNKLRVLNQMGVPNGADYAMLARQIPNVTGAGAAFTRNSTIKPKFNALRQQVARTVDATAKALKFTPQQQEAQQPAASAAGDMVPMLDPQGRPRMVPRARVQDAIAAGGRLQNG